MLPYLDPHLTLPVVCSILRTRCINPWTFGSKTVHRLENSPEAPQMALSSSSFHPLLQPQKKVLPSPNSLFRVLWFRVIRNWNKRMNYSPGRAGTWRRGQWGSLKMEHQDARGRADGRGRGFVQKPISALQVTFQKWKTCCYFEINFWLDCTHDSFWGWTFWVIIFLISLNKGL